MIYNIEAPKTIKTKISLPSSKSMSNRALIMKALSWDKIEINNLSDSNDTQILRKALNSSDPYININDAGTAMRFLTAYLSIKEGIREIDGSERMRERPIEVLVDALKCLGADISYLDKTGYPPLMISGKHSLSGGDLYISGNVSSQYISAILMIAPMNRDELRIHINNPVSNPYIDMTVKMLSHFDINIQRSEGCISVIPGFYNPKAIDIEPDWSSASYWYLITLLSNDAEVELENLTLDSMQGDRVCADIFESLGVRTSKTLNGSLILKKENSRLRKLFFNFIDYPDLVQTCVVACCMKGIHFLFNGLNTLRIKETDRITALKNELKKLGFVLNSPDENSLEWDGTTIDAEKNPIIHTYNDHRMALAFASLALINDTIQIDSPEVVKKSYPAFWTDLSKSGFIISETNE